MKTGLRSLVLLSLTFNLIAGTSGGIQPRRSGADYPQYEAKNGITLGVALLTPEQVRGNFVSDLNRGFLVVEVAVFPDKGKSIDLSHSDFLLRSRTKELVGRPADPKAIAASLQRAASSDRDVMLYPSATIGYESGPPYYDPVTGTRRGGGVYTGVGVGVGMGRSGAGATDQDRRTMELELTEKGLPEGIASKAVSGYLYFSLKERKKGETYHLEFTAVGEPIVLPVQPDKTKR